MDITTIPLKKFQSIIMDAPVKTEVTDQASTSYALTLNAHLMSQGYVLSEALFTALKSAPNNTTVTLAETLLPAIKQLKGSHVIHKPMYPNFPEQVINASDAELYLNAIVHYYTQGEWLPNYEALPREFAFENVKFQAIDMIDTATFYGLFSTLLSSHDSLSDEDKAIIKWFMAQDFAASLTVPSDMPFHENKCLVAAKWIEQKRDITELVKTTTDVLRIASYLSDGDVSLADNTRFKSLPRATRRVLISQLERVINEEDIGRHRNKWVRLFHNLHIGEYASKQTFQIAQKARNGAKLASFYSDVEAAVQAQDIDACIRLLSKRPGEFGRKLDHILRVAAGVDAVEKHSKNGAFSVLTSFAKLRQAIPESQHHQKMVVEGFLAVVDDIPARNLLQLLGHLNSRAHASNERVVYPKGNLQKAIIVTTPLDAMSSNLLVSLQTGIHTSLTNRLSTLAPLGKVWIAPELIDCPLPSQQRSASAGLHNMARGTRLPIAMDTEEKDTLRLFVYWKGQDIDLSATFHAENGALIEHVSYTNLRSGKYKAYHSGDITNAKRGASEFIDVDIPSAAKRARYLAMNVLVYSGPTFEEHETCFVGWMNRSKPNSNEVYEPATVAQKVDLKQGCRNVMPVVFDLVERKIIWTDLPASRGNFSSNNVENNQASIEQKLRVILNVSNKLSLYELFELHAAARGELVTDRDDAETVFALDGDVTPFDVNTINAEFMG